MSEASDLIRFTNGRLCIAGHLVRDDLWVSPLTGHIVSPPDATCHSFTTYDLAGRILAPGFIEVQLNGGYGFDFSVASDNYRSSVATLNRKLVRTGVTSYLPTLTSQLTPVYQKTLPYLAAPRTRNPSDGSESLGAHCEGPFISPVKNGIHSPSVLQTPTHGLASLAACYGADNLVPSRIRMVTLAPELDGVVGPGVLIPALVAKGIVVSIGHSEASYEQACAAVKQGASMVTHLFNAIPQMHHRVPGIFGVLGAQDVRRPCFGLISDGVHVHPSFVRVVWGAHPGGLILVTDAMRVLGLADGTYEWTNGEVIVKKGGRVTLGKGDKIAGSCVTLVECLENFVNWTGASVAEGVRTITETPAVMLGIERHKGMLKPGADADLVVLDDREEGGKIMFSIGEVWKFGVRVFDGGIGAKL